MTDIICGNGKLKMLVAAPQADELAVIASRIRARIRRTTADIIDTGNDLIEVQKKLDGKFIAWIEAEFGMTPRAAQLYMQAARFAGERCEMISHLPPTTVYKLSAPSTPEEIKAEVVADLEAGRPVDHRAIEGRIKIEKRSAAANSASPYAGRLIDTKITALAMKAAQKLAVGKSAEWLDDYFTAFERAMVELVKARRQ